MATPPLDPSQYKRPEDQVKAKPGPRERSARIIRLKEELNLILELVVHSREALTNELDSEFAQKKRSIDAVFLKKLKELTIMYETLTKSRISLDKAEHALEREMTPADELRAVRDFIKSLEPMERGENLRDLIKWHNEQMLIVNKGQGRPPRNDVVLDG